ncbi:uncharacterized protein OCT59_015692 [Rhizophagus irregularis]|uniref:uncharacterized protein n=1 Tax=Rhizophagus irregularis TaxID=588596 RepID=UPI000CBC1973|nr:hypothetical protein OCT59_015692 [Rhizophagus irregularis]GBC49411.1 hypothetical protein RIR_jg42529.t1 [Rhizophagus irregularis DAOM 181602=DAOM 197198]
MEIWKDFQLIHDETFHENSWMSSGWQNCRFGLPEETGQVTEGGTCSREWIDRRIGIGNDAGVVPEAVAAVVAVAVAVAVAAAAVAIGGEEEEIEEEEKSLGCQSMGY